MKKFSRIFLCIALAATICFSAVACSDTQTEPLFLVTVEGGSGGGYYYADVNCTVTATVPDGKQFMKWLAGNEEVSAKASYTFTVEDDITLTAVFADAVTVADAHEINVSGGYGSGLYMAGTQCTLEIPEKWAPRVFTRWMTLSQDEDGADVLTPLSDQNPYIFTVSKDMNIVAEYQYEAFAAPGNDIGQMFNIEAGSGAYVFDRNKHDGNPNNADEGNRKTVFVSGVAYVLYYVYDSTIPSAQPISTFKIVLYPDPIQVGPDTIRAYVSTSDGSDTANIKGALGNFYQDANKADIRRVMGVEEGKTYYFAAQIISTPSSVTKNSEISVRGPAVTF